VKIYDKNDEWLNAFSEYGSEPGQNSKSEFTDTQNGLYYIPKAGNHRVSAWDLEGNFKFTFGIDKDANIYIGEIGNNRIQVFKVK